MVYTAVDLLITETGTKRGFLLDYHFNRIDSQSKFLALGDGICDSATAVGYLCVKVHPTTRLRLSHQQDVHLRGERFGD